MAVLHDPKYRVIIGGASVAGWLPFKSLSSRALQSHSTRVVELKGPRPAPLDTMGLTHDPTFQKLEKWYHEHALHLNMRKMFEEDKERFHKFRYLYG